jgi:hypothetical protein
MTAIAATTLSQELFERATAGRNTEFNRGLTFAAALYLMVAIVELSILFSRHQALRRLARFT